MIELDRIESKILDSRKGSYSLWPNPNPTSESCKLLKYTCYSASLQLGSYEEEIAPLVAAAKGENEFEHKNLRNPATSYEVESHEQFLVNKVPKTSNMATMMHLLKGNIGTGILAMPSAVGNAGLLVGSIGIPILGIICVHCMHLLVKCSKRLALKTGCSSLDYANTAEHAFRLGPRKIQPFSKFARSAVNTMLMLTQFGFCCVYFLFVSKSIFEIVKSLTGTTYIGSKGYMAMVLPFMIFFNFIRTLKGLAPASIIANVLQVVGLGLLFYYLLQGITRVHQPPLTAPLEKLPLYFGTAMYAFEGIGVILPLENAMAHPEDFGGLTGVLNTGMVIIACLYTAVGFFGYLKYGTAVQSSITFNLVTPIMSDIIKLIFAVAIFLSYGLQLYVPLQIISPWLRKKFALERFSERLQQSFDIGLRVLLVLITFSLAISIPMLDLFISLVGALASSSLALIFPPIMECATIWNSDKGTKWFPLILAKNTAIMMFGICGCIIGTYTSIKEIVNCFKIGCES